MPKLLDNQIASRYAKAVFDATCQSAEDQNVEAQLNVVQDDLKSLADIMAQMPTLKTFFENPAIPHFEKEAFVATQLASKVNAWVGNLLKLMAKNGRMTILPQVSEQFEQLLNRHRHIATAEVMSASELEPKQLERLQKTLEERFGFSRVELHNRVEPGILGGAIVKIQDQIIDGSFSGRLETLKKQLA